MPIRAGNKSNPSRFDNAAARQELAHKPIFQGLCLLAKRVADEQNGTDGKPCEGIFESLSGAKTPVDNGAARNKDKDENRAEQIRLLLVRGDAAGEPDDKVSEACREQ